MRISSIQISVAMLSIAIAGVMIFDGCSASSTPNDTTLNRPPQIDSIIIDPKVVIVGQPTTITCYARDEDGDALSYYWRATEGDIIGGGSSIHFIPAPCCSGFTTKIRVIVSDGSDDTSAELTLLVF